MTNWKDRGFVNHDFINMTKKKIVKRTKVPKNMVYTTIWPFVKDPPSLKKYKI